jgi:hypothetical protein
VQRKLSDHLRGRRADLNHLRQSIILSIATKTESIIHF